MRPPHLSVATAFVFDVATAFAFDVAFAFLSVIPSEARNLLLSLPLPFWLSSRRDLLLPLLVFPLTFSSSHL